MRRMASVLSDAPSTKAYPGSWGCIGRRQEEDATNTRRAQEVTGMCSLQKPSCSYNFYHTVPAPMFSIRGLYWASYAFFPTHSIQVRVMRLLWYCGWRAAKFRVLKVQFNVKTSNSDLDLNLNVCAQKCSRDEICVAVYTFYLWYC